MRDSEYLNTSDTAELIGISKSTLEKWRVYGGGIPFIRAGRLVKYSRADIAEWMTARRRKSTSDRVDMNLDQGRHAS